MRNLTALSIILLSLLFSACKTSQKVIEMPLPTTEFEDLDTMVITAERPDKLKDADEITLPSYNASYTQRNNLLHTKLDLKFDSNFLICIFYVYFFSYHPKL